MLEKDKAKLHALIFEISKLSTDIDTLKKKRDDLLSKFKKTQIQLVNNKVEPAHNRGIVNLYSNPPARH